jgi:hypothetical protein
MAMNSIAMLNYQRVTPMKTDYGSFPHDSLLRTSISLNVSVRSTIHQENIWSELSELNQPR